MSSMAKPKKRRTSNNNDNNTNVVAKAKVKCMTNDGLRVFPPRLLHNKNEFKPCQSKVEALVPNAVYFSRNALSSSECQEWIKFAEDESKFDAVNHPSTRSVAHRECGRIQIDDWNMSHRLYQRIESIVHQISGQLNIFDKATRSTAKNRNSNNSPKYQPLSCNPNLRLYKYAKGQSFGRHFDGASDIQFVSGSPYSKANVKEAQTEMTVLFYLSSCRGGATRFHLPHGKNVFGGGNGKKKCNGFDGSVAFVPEEGAVLLHVHGDRCLEHEAEPVRDGIKYVLRTDVIFGIM
mmetsp:Transcript_1369/g.2870  ORF Transcript_1369/g.2870 Transcript_1369/m.2870 type:complete len:292 (-) Transcript_1369:953-1828(-)